MKINRKKEILINFFVIAFEAYKIVTFHFRLGKIPWKINLSYD